MYVRDAKNRDEAWLLDHIEAMGLDDMAFRSRDYVIAVDEESNDRVGFGRLRIHTGDPELCELTGIGVLEPWRGQGVGAHVIERLVETAAAEDFETVYSLTDEPGYLERFGFEPVDDAALPDRLRERLSEKRSIVDEAVIGLRIGVDAFDLSADDREAFKNAVAEGEPDADHEESPEDFGIDPDTATYKYDTGS